MIEVVFDHVAIAVERWRDAWPRLAGDLGGRWSSGGPGPGFSPMQIRFANGMKIELIEPHDVDKNDFLRRFLDRHGPGPHHLTFKVPDLGSMLGALERGGFPPINVDTRDPTWHEGFVHPHHVGIVVQVAHAPEGEWESRPPDDFPQTDRDPASLAYVGLAVRSIDATVRLFVDVLKGVRVDEGSDEAARWVELAWKGPGRLRLLEPLSTVSPLADWLGDRPGRLHHVAFHDDEACEFEPDAVVGTRLLVTPA